MIPFYLKLRDLVYDKGITQVRFEEETGITRKIFYRTGNKHRKATLMAIAYYLDMSVEELIDGTDADG